MSKEMFDFKVSPRTIAVVKVDEVLQHVTFDQQWFCAGDIVVDFRDPDHDVTLDTEMGTNTFAYRGTIKVGELYCVGRDKMITNLT